MLVTGGGKVFWAQIQPGRGPGGAGPNPYFMAPAQPPTRPFPDPCISQGLSHTPLRSKAHLVTSRVYPWSEPHGHIPGPGFTCQVCLYQEGGGADRSDPPLLALSFISVLRDRAGLAPSSLAVPGAGSCSVDTWSCHPAAATPAPPCLPHLVPQSQTVVNTQGADGHEVF